MEIAVTLLLLLVVGLTLRLIRITQEQKEINQAYENLIDVKEQLIQILRKQIAQYEITDVQVRKLIQSVEDIEIEINKNYENNNN